MDVYEHILQGIYDLPSYLDAQARDLIRKLLNPESRLRPTISGIRSHPYFNDVNWCLADNVALAPPALTETSEPTKEQFRTNLFDR